MIELTPQPVVFYILINTRKCTKLYNGEGDIGNCKGGVKDYIAQGRKGVGRVSVAGDGGRSPGAEQFTVTSCKGIICRLVSFWL